MNDEQQAPDLQNASDDQLEGELEKRMEQRAEEWGNNLEKKIKNVEKKIPKPISAFLDGVCLGVIILAVCWLMAKIGWITMPAWRTFGIIFVIIFLISLVYRYIFKSSK